jgi:hypothetical protein
MDKEDTIKYPVRTMRLSDEVWESLKVAQKESGKSWNLFIKELNINGGKK